VAAKIKEYLEEGIPVQVEMLSIFHIYLKVLLELLNVVNVAIYLRYVRIVRCQLK
jgi:hypothetical protein